MFSPRRALTFERKISRGTETWPVFVDNFQSNRWHTCEKKLIAVFVLPTEREPGSTREGASSPRPIAMRRRLVLPSLARRIYRLFSWSIKRRGERKKKKKKNNNETNEECLLVSLSRSASDSSPFRQSRSISVRTRRVGQQSTRIPSGQRCRISRGRGWQRIYRTDSWEKIKKKLKKFVQKKMMVAIKKFGTIFFTLLACDIGHIERVSGFSVVRMLDRKKKNDKFLYMTFFT